MQAARPVREAARGNEQTATLSPRPGPTSLGRRRPDRCRRRVQQDLHGHRGRAGDPLYAARRTLHTGYGLLTYKQRDRLAALFALEEHIEVEATY